MKISFQIMSLKSGGAEKILAFLANELAKRGHEVFVLCIGEYYSPPFFKIEKSVKIMKITGWNDKKCIRGEHKFFRNSYRVGLMRRELRRIKPDVAVSFLNNMIIPTAWAAYTLGIPHIACERNSPWDTPEHPRKRNRRDRAFSISRGCVVQTEQVKSYFSKRTQKKIVVQANPVLLSKVNMDIPVPYEARRKCIVSVGRFAAQKNQAMLINAFAEFHKVHPEYQLVIYGQDYGKKQELEKLIVEKRLIGVIHLLDPVEHLHEMIVDAAMFVLTSYYEGFPNALAEASALGVPCISTECKSGGPSYILREGKAGVLVPNNDVGALTKAMRLLVEDEMVSRKISEIGVELSTILSPVKYVDFWEKYLTEMAKC